MKESGPKPAQDSAPKTTGEVIEVDFKKKERVKTPSDTQNDAQLIAENQEGLKKLVEQIASLTPDTNQDKAPEKTKDTKSTAHDKLVEQTMELASEARAEEIEQKRKDEFSNKTIAQSEALTAQLNKDEKKIELIEKIRAKIKAAREKQGAQEPQNIIDSTKTPATIYPIEMPLMDSGTARRSVEGGFKRAMRFIGEKLGFGLEKTNEVLHRTPLVAALLGKLERQRIRARNTAPLLVFDRMYAWRNAKSEEAKFAYAASDQTVKDLEKGIADIDASVKEHTADGTLDARSARRAEKDKEKIRRELVQAKIKRDHFAHRLQTFNGKKAYWENRHKTRVEEEVNYIHERMSPHKEPLEKHTLKQKEVAAELEKHTKEIASNEEKLKEFKAKLNSKTSPKVIKSIARQKLKELERLQKKNRTRLTELKQQENRTSGKLVRITNRTRPWENLKNELAHGLDRERTYVQPNRETLEPDTSRREYPHEQEAA